MKYIKHIQSLAQNSTGSEISQPKTINDKFRNIPPKVTSQFNAAVTKSRHRISQPSLEDKIGIPLKTGLSPTRTMNKSNDKPTKPKLEIRQLRDFGEISRKEDVTDCQGKVIHRGVQTECSDDISKLYDNGVIKYPSPSIIEQSNQNKWKYLTKPNHDHGDHSIDEKLNALKFQEKPDYIKQNIAAVKQRTSHLETIYTSGAIPPTYRKGMLPKYLKERKDEQLKDLPQNDECPDGHVLLPEEERKETLRVLRQSYADRIQELNSMPVRNDTLRMRKRKMELEEELKKIDEGIKVFQRPKVFVKINV